MIITIDSLTGRVDITTEGNESEEGLHLKIAKLLRVLADRLDPPTNIELIVNQDRIDDITPELHHIFLTTQEGGTH